MDLRLSTIFTFLLLHGMLSAQHVSGVIRDNSGISLENATVLIKGTTAYAVTDSIGQFKIAIDQPLPVILEISYVGYRSQEIQVDHLSGIPMNIVLVQDNFLEEVVVTSRRREEDPQQVPIPISVVSGAMVEESGAFNVNRVKELIPTVQLYSSNPRNTALNIRGLGTTFGLTNDGVEPGVGFYVDGVFYARPAATTLDFIDVEQIEVLRGPQGTLFGKNTTSGAFNVTTRKPEFDFGASFEVSYGNYGYVQAKSSITGPLSKTLAARLSFSGSQRDGFLYNVATQKHVNDLNNIGIRGQLLFVPTTRLRFNFTADMTRQRPNGFAQVVAGVVPTLRAPYRQFNQILADLNYSLPSENPFDRLIDHNTPWRSDNDLGGISLNVDYKIGSGTLTSTSAWRYWDWDPSNDRDFTGLPVLTRSEGTSRHRNWSQEVRYAGTFSSRLSGVVGVFVLGQDLNTDPVHTEESGSAQWRFSQNSTSPLWQTPGLFEGYGIKTRSELKTFSGAIFGQVDWFITDRLHVLPGLRLNYDQKSVDFDRQTYGGLQTEDPALLALKNAVYSNQTFKVDVDDTNLSGQLTLAYIVTERIKTFLTYSTSFKSVGLNLGGLPSSGGVPLLDLAKIKPEDLRHLEFGVKTSPTTGSNVNVTVFNTDIRDFQTQVQTAELGVNRGYLSNAERVRVRGVELEGNFRFNKHVVLNFGGAYTDGVYISFTNAPVPLEETGGESAFKDISGSVLPGISKWAANAGGEFSVESTFLGKQGKYFIAFDAYYRSDFSSSPSASKYLVVDAYALLNMRLGFRATQGVSVSCWVRNLLDENYFEQLLPAAGNAGHYAAVLGDPRTFGVTLRHTL